MQQAIKSELHPQMQAVMITHVFLSNTCWGDMCPFPENVLDALSYAIKFAERCGFEIEKDVWAYMVTCNLQPEQVKILKQQKTDNEKISGILQLV